MPRYIPGAAYWWPMAPKPPVHRRSSARCTSRRWRLLACPYWAGKEPPAEPHRRAHDDRRPYTASLLVVSKRALRRGAYKEEGAPRSFPDTPASVPFCWSITAFSACVILPQMNRQPMCIWMVKPPFTQYISEANP